MSELWCWVEDLAEPGAIELSAEESRHVSARRLRAGAAVVLFDGLGRYAEARIESLGRRSTVAVCETILDAPPPDGRIVLASAIPKGDRLSTMLQMLTQLGAARWQPLLLDESVVRKLDVEAARLTRILIESCKVSRRPWRLEVDPLRTLDDALGQRPSEVPLYFGDREGARGGFDGSGGWVVVGPEAGFSEVELGVLARAGARAVSFGPYNLRIETAVAAAASSLQTASSP